MNAVAAGTCSARSCVLQWRFPARRFHVTRTVPAQHVHSRRIPHDAHLPAQARLPSIVSRRNTEISAAPAPAEVQAKPRGRHAQSE